VTCAVATADPLVDYLELTGGRDILLFESMGRATEAARILRDRHPDVHVDARYDKVFLKLKDMT